MFEFHSSEQLEIRSSVQKLAAAEVPKYQNETFFGTLPRELFNKLASIGLAGLAIDADAGGIDASPTTVAMIIQELAEVDLGPAIFISVHSMVSGLIRKFGNDDQKARYLPRMATGELLGAFALTEPAAGSDAGGLKTVARHTPQGFVLNGEKCYITSAGWADLYLVFAKTSPEKGSDGISAFIVEARSPGLTVSKPEKKMGCELSPIASISFSELVVPTQNLVGTVDNGYKIALGGLAGGRISIAACANGLSRAAIYRAKAHMKQRKQFGKVIGEFQGLQFMLADMQMKAEAAELLTWQAAHTLENDPGSRKNRLYPAYAKCFATDAAMAITTDAVQILGGAGYIREYEVERLMRDAKMLQIVEGTNQIQRMVIARELLA